MNKVVHTGVILKYNANLINIFQSYTILFGKISIFG